MRVENSAAVFSEPSLAIQTLQAGEEWQPPPPRDFEVTEVRGKKILHFIIQFENLDVHLDIDYLIDSGEVRPPATELVPASGPWGTSSLLQDQPDFLRPRRRQQLDRQRSAGRD